MNDVTEYTIIKRGNVRVTTQRIMIGPKMHFLSNIVSARMDVNEPNFFLPVFLMLPAAACLALIALVNMREWAYYLEIGLYVAVAGFIFLLISTRTKYSVRLMGTVGELKIWETTNKEAAETVAIAVNEAIRIRKEASETGVSAAQMASNPNQKRLMSAS
jgi:hypothetical protein